MFRSILVRKNLIAAGVGLCCATAAIAQTADTIDPMTGNYVPGRDPFNATPKADNNNPYRLKNRLSKRVGKSVNEAPQPDNSKAATAQDTAPPSSAGLQYPSWWPK